MDEITRYQLLDKAAKDITLKICLCGAEPTEMFKSDKEYFVKCKSCGTRTDHYKHLYQAKLMWNAGIFK